MSHAHKQAIWTQENKPSTSLEIEMSRRMYNMAKQLDHVETELAEKIAELNSANHSLRMYEDVVNG